PNRQLTVREISVRMEIAEDNRAAVFSLSIRPEKTLKLLRRRIFRRSKFKNKAGDLQGRVRFAESRNTRHPFLQYFFTAAESGVERVQNCVGIRREAAAVVLDDQPGI